MNTTLLIIQAERKQPSTKKLFLSLLSGFVFLILINQQAQAQNCTVNAGVDDVICPTEPMQLHGTSAGLYTGMGNIHWTQRSGPTVNIVDKYNLNTYITGFNEDTQYSFYLWAKCKDGSLVKDSVNITVQSLSIADAGANLASCPGTSILTLAGNVPDPTDEVGLWQVVGTNYGVTINSSSAYNSTITLSVS